LIFLGSFRLAHFYSAFGVEILSYLNITEIITSFFDKIVLSEFMIILILSLYVSLFSKGNNLDTLNDKFASYVKKKTKSKILLSIIAIVVLFVYMAVFLLFLSLIFLLVPGQYPWKSGNDFSLTLLILSLIFFYLFSNPNRYLRISGFVYLILFGLFITAYVYVLSNQDVSFVKEKKKYKNVNIIFDDGRIINSDSSNYFIGKTNDYLFFYHEKDKITDVFRMEHIKRLSLK
jgi:hypothetical protein